MESKTVMDTPTHIPWNFVTKNIERDEFIEKKIQDKVATLERHLKNFPPDSAHLHVALERNPKKDEHTVRLTLRVPSYILHSEKTADDLIKALGLAVDSLAHDLEAFKAILTGERYWKRKARREQLHLLKSAAFAFQAQPAGTGPQNYEDVVRDLFQQHYRDLLHHARRHIRHDEEAGEIPPGSIDAREVVEEARRRAAARAAERPKGVGWMIWFYHLIHQELKRRRNLVKGQTEATSEAPVKQPPPGEAAGAAPKQAGEQEPDPLDELVTQKDTLELLQRDLRTWPRTEREVFELYYLEGLDPQEIAMVSGYPLKAVQESLVAIRQKLRERLSEQKLAA